MRAGTLAFILAFSSKRKYGFVPHSDRFCNLENLCAFGDAEWTIVVGRLLYQKHLGVGP